MNSLFKAGSAGGIRWRLVLSAGVGVGAGVTVLFYYLPVLVINHYAILLFFLGQDSLWGVGTVELGSLVGLYGMPALYLLLTVLAASWVARRVRTTAPLHGMLTGVVSGVVSVILIQTLSSLVFGPPNIIVLVLYLVLAVGGGLVGGLRGWNVLAGQAVLYEASRDVGAARDPQAIVAAIGERLAGSEVNGVALWEATWPDGVPREGVPAGFELLASWPPALSASPGARLDANRIPALKSLRRGQSSLVLRVKEMQLSELKMREGSALLLPLISSNGLWVGLLTVSSRKKRGFSRSARRAYLTVATPVTLALENLGLAEQARRAGLLGERRRLAHEIHDTLAQGFTSIVMNLEAAEATLSSESSPQTRRHLDQARLTARESLTEARRLVWALRPKLLEEAPLPEALMRLARRWSETSGVTTGASVTGAPRALPPEVEVTLLRVAQEALANVRKHAQAGQAALTLSYMDDRVALDVRDDGVGFDPESRSSRPDNSGGGVGLGNMRERVEQLNGTLIVESYPGEGTTLVVELPVVDEPSGDPPARGS